MEFSPNFGKIMKIYFLSHNSRNIALMLPTFEIGLGSILSPLKMRLDYSQ